MLEKRSFWIAFYILVAYSLATIYIYFINNMGMDQSTLRSSDDLFIGNAFGDYFFVFNLLFPFLVVFPYSFSFIEDKSTKIIPYIIVRSGKWNYFFSKSITTFIGGFLLFFIPFIFNIVILSVAFHYNFNTFLGTYKDVNYCRSLIGSNVIIKSVSYGMSFIGIYLYSPIIYNVLYTFFISIFSGILSLFSFSCSLKIKRLKVLVFLPPYILIYFFNIINNFSYVSNKYLNTRLLDYVTVNYFYGKSTLFFVAICLTILIFSLLYIILNCKNAESFYE